MLILKDLPAWQKPSRKPAALGTLGRSVNRARFLILGAGRKRKRRQTICRFLEFSLIPRLHRLGKRFK
jgi:hypothetical protein